MITQVYLDSLYADTTFDDGTCLFGSEGDLREAGHVRELPPVGRVATRVFFQRFLREIDG